MNNEQQEINIELLSRWIIRTMKKCDKKSQEYANDDDFETAQFYDGMSSGLQVVWDKLHGCYDERNL